MSKAAEIDYKISVLRDFRILDRRMKKRESEIRYILKHCDSVIQMDNKLRDLLCGRISIDDFIDKEQKKIAGRMSMTDFLIYS